MLTVRIGKPFRDIILSGAYWWARVYLSGLGGNVTGGGLCEYFQSIAMMGVLSDNPSGTRNLLVYNGIDLQFQLIIPEVLYMAPLPCMGSMEVKYLDVVHMLTLAVHTTLQPRSA